MERFRICKDCDFSGVYAIINSDSKKIYVGSSRNIEKRLKNHKTNLQSGNHANKLLLNDYLNGDSFCCKVVSPVPLYRDYNKDMYLREYERIVISMIESTGKYKVYNTRDTGEDVSILENIIKFIKEMEG